MRNSGKEKGTYLGHGDLSRLSRNSESTVSRHADSSTKSNTVHNRNNRLVSRGEDVVLLK
jgi:hypothetical protein